MRTLLLVICLASSLPALGQTASSPATYDDNAEFMKYGLASEADVSALEASLSSSPDDRLTRIRLFGCYWSKTTFYKRPDLRHNLVQQADWFAIHEPASIVFDRSNFALQKTDFDPPYAADLQTYKSHWKAAVGKNLSETAVLLHASQAMNAVDLEVPFVCASRLRILMPTYPQFALQLAADYVRLVVIEASHPDATPATDKFPVITALAKAQDSAVIGLTGQMLYDAGRKGGKTEAFVQQAEALLQRAHELDPANTRWTDALHAAPSQDVATAIANLNIMKQEDLWPNGKVPALPGSQNAETVSPSVQAAKLVSPTAAFIENVLHTQDGPGNVRLTALIGEDGKVQTLQFASGSVRLFPYALGMVTGWRYTPTLVDGKPVRVLTQVDLKFAAPIQQVGPPVAGEVMGGLLAGRAVAGMSSDPNSVVKAAPPKQINVSGGVMSGNILSKTSPVYPAVAKAARVQGIVVLQATISKTGTVEGLTVVSGPPLLQQAAVDAVKTWTYRPYLLNGEPVQVATQINVVFSLGIQTPDQAQPPQAPQQAPR